MSDFTNIVDKLMAMDEKMAELVALYIDNTMPTHHHVNGMTDDELAELDCYLFPIEEKK